MQAKLQDEIFCRREILVMHYFGHTLEHNLHNWLLFFFFKVNNAIRSENMSFIFCYMRRLMKLKIQTKSSKLGKGFLKHVKSYNSPHIANGPRPM